MSVEGSVLDIRDLIERVEELEGERDDYNTAPECKGDTDVPWDEYDGRAARELHELLELLDELKNAGGDHQWRGDWYPVTLIADSYFEQYAREYAEDIGAIEKEMNWPCYCIDWERAAKDLQTDYSSVEYDGETYWYR